AEYRHAKERPPLTHRQAYVQIAESGRLIPEPSTPPPQRRLPNSVRRSFWNCGGGTDPGGQGEHGEACETQPSDQARGRVLAEAGSQVIGPVRASAGCCCQ